jgi:hypothetical protein
MSMCVPSVKRSLAPTLLLFAINLYPLIRNRFSSLF